MSNTIRILTVGLYFGLSSGCGGTTDEAIPQGPATIYEAAKAGDIARVRELIELNQWDPQSPDGNGVTPLNYAAENGDVEMIRLMVEYGAAVNHVDVNLDTPLKCAERAGNTEAIALLKELGATE
jgi:ankyrin repeat protein